MADSLVGRVIHSVGAGIVGMVGGALVGSIVPMAFHNEATAQYISNLIPYCAASGAAVGGIAFFIGEFLNYGKKP